MGPGVFFFRHEKNADILGRTDVDFENFSFFDFFGSQISGLGPLGPSLGPPTWAQRGPTHLGPDAAGAAGAGAGAGRILRSQPDPSPNAPRDEIRRKDPCCDLGWFGADFKISFGSFGSYIAPLGPGGVLK